MANCALLRTVERRANCTRCVNSLLLASARGWHKPCVTGLPADRPTLCARRKFFTRFIDDGNVVVAGFSLQNGAPTDSPFWMGAKHGPKATTAGLGRTRGALGRAPPKDELQG